MSTYTAAVLALSPYAYWRLNEAAGFALADSSGNGNVATLKQYPIWGPSYSNTGPIVGDATSKALGISSLGNGVVATNNTVAYQHGATAVSDVGWFNLASYPASGTSGVFLRLVTVSKYVYLGVNPSGQLVVSYYSAAGVLLGGALSVIVSSATWHMFAVTLDAFGNLTVSLDNNVVLYVSGTMLPGTDELSMFGSEAVAVSTLHPDANTAVGSLWSEASVFSAALTPTQVTGLWIASGRPVTVQPSFGGGAHISANVHPAFTAGARTTGIALASISAASAISQPSVPTTFAAGAHIAQSQSRTITAGANVSRPSSPTFTAAARVLRSIIFQFPVNAQIRVTSLRSLSAGANVASIGGAQKTFNAGAVTSERQAMAFSAGALLTPLTTRVAVGAGAAVYQPIVRIALQVAAFISIRVGTSFFAAAQIGSIGTTNDREVRVRAHQRRVDVFPHDTERKGFR